jgi:hypothetical protein
MLKTLSSNPSTVKKRKKEGKEGIREGEREEGGFLVYYLWELRPGS